MPALVPLHNLSARAFRAATGLAGIVLLLLQTLGPALASPGQSVWMEICSEAGAVWVEVDLEDETSDPTAPCPKCADCALCALTIAAPVPDLPQLTRAGIVQFVRCEFSESFELYNSNRLWPETRGPPLATHKESERALRASMAPTQVIGGAPWS
ncbi:hypothetical protein SAMN05444358_10489 [Ruegeria halocynthiae]|uniref:DUF2946 domain-containing protein n=1 Tax=Ruegeria halocynthiae TaxID=985054 RepID=A0A1H3A939_9RHOB|nr:DUF2946 family protein [Ruegeria halocynthiae]SDX26133.1 hypothetical protein SAMN05444358_10489 [Ruegeria halocynthiae]